MKAFIRRIFLRHPQLFIGLGIVLLGVLATFGLIKLKRAPKRVDIEPLAPLVRVQQIKITKMQMIISGFGTVIPTVEVEIVPQVSGKAVYVNPAFKAGGFIKAGETILEIDKRDYELAVQQAEAIVAEAVVTLDMEKAEAAVAVDEWKQLNPGTKPASPLVLRQPQIRRAEAKLKAAEAGLAMARLSLERAEISLPVDVRVVSERVDLGQFVSMGQSLGTAYGMESVEVEVPLEDEDLAWFDIYDEMISYNGNAVSKKFTEAEVKANFAGGEHIWKGFVKRTTGEVDRTSRLVRVVVEIPKPFEKTGGKPALLPGTFVEVLIKGKVLEQAAAVPRDAIREGNKVWIVNDDRLHIQLLEIARSDRDFAYAVSGISDGAYIIVSSLDTVTEGMKVRTK